MWETLQGKRWGAVKIDGSSGGCGTLFATHYCTHRYTDPNRYRYTYTHMYVGMYYKYIMVCTCMYTTQHTVQVHM